MEHTLDFSDNTFDEEERTAKKMLELCIYNYMIKRDHPEAANIFAQKANIEISELGDDENFLEDLWSFCWPLYRSKLCNKSGANPQSFTLQVPAQRGGEDSRGPRKKGKGPLGFPPVNLVPTQLPLVPHSTILSHSSFHIQLPPPQLAGPHRSVQLHPTYPPPHHFPYSPTTPFPGENIRNSSNSSNLQMRGTIQAPPEVAGADLSVQLQPTYRAAQNLPYPPTPPFAGENIRNSSNSSNLQMRGTIQAPPEVAGADLSGQLQPTYRAAQNLPYPPTPPFAGENIRNSSNSSNLQMCGTIQAPPEVAGADLSVQLQPTYRAAQNLPYPPTTPFAGENIRNKNNQGSTLTGYRVNAIDGCGPSIKNQVPDAYLEMMRQEAEERGRLNPSHGRF